jgi:AraC-like DNA-binding protein
VVSVPDDGLRIRVDSDDEAPRQRLDYWRHVTSQAFVPLDVRTEQAPKDFRGQVLSRHGGGVWASHLTGSSGDAHRTPTLIRRSDAEVYKVQVQIGGRLLGTQDDREALLRPGDLLIYDTTRPYATGPLPRRVSGTQPFSLLALMIPRALVPLSPNDVALLTATRISGQRGLGRLISQMLTQMARDLDEYEQAELVCAMTAAIDILTTALAGQLGRAGLVPEHARSRSLLSQAHAFIEDRLADPDLSPSVVAAAHHVSLRMLQKLFEEQGTSVASWIRRRRLERCRRELLNPRSRASTVRAIARQWGFSDPAHFSRAFRAVYGAPPGDYREQWMPSPCEH